MNEPAPPQIKSARLASESESDLERHRSFLQTTNVGELDIKHNPIPPKRDEEWEVVAEWDAIPELPKRSTRWLGGLLGYPEEHFWPRFITWNPSGRSLMISRDSGNLTAWTRNGGRIGGKQLKKTYGWVDRAYWSSNESWVLIEGIPRFNYSVTCVWSIWDQRGKVKCWFAPDLYRFGSGNSPMYSMNQPEPVFNPWRPHASQFLKWNQELRRLDLFDLDKIPSRIEGSAERYVSQAVELATLPSDDQQVENFAWHPSGRYIAFVAVMDNKNTHGCVRRVHLLDWDSAQIVATTPPFVVEEHGGARPFAVSWSPGGQWLVIDQDVSQVWDVRTGEVITLDKEQREAGWAKRIKTVAYARDMNVSWLSCDGERTLIRRQVGWEEEGPLTVIGTREGYLQELPPALTATWSPADPHCFATVARHLVRVWKLKGSPTLGTQ